MRIVQLDAAQKWQQVDFVSVRSAEEIGAILNDVCRGRWELVCGTGFSELEYMLTLYDAVDWASVSRILQAVNDPYCVCNVDDVPEVPERAMRAALA